MSRRWLAALALGMGIALASSVPFRSDLCWGDPVTGSLKLELKRFLVPVSTTVQTSALERWIVRREGGHTNQWQFLSDTSSWWPLPSRGHACGRTPEIYELCKPTFNEAFVRCSSDAEIAEFLRVMRQGSAEEKKAAVESACERAFGYLARRRGPDSRAGVTSADDPAAASAAP
ncbi:hypothetical protein OJF2_74800 [Aquisphaera giovannonii]|uniref:Uncharacterized protein n=1 Tax=Aquisphaera giovannonii TaxID=406548 RepID=A0A5B9WGA0_9BACT|nr:hypothetical protein [Aquisphaera giovannonii]QEH38870.1 hypothetical protein OJF2_74800 [Aquisphaera giovannonii]